MTMTSLKKHKNAKKLFSRVMTFFTSRLLDRSKLSVIGKNERSDNRHALGMIRKIIVITILAAAIDVSISSHLST